MSWEDGAVWKYYSYYNNGATPPMRDSVERLDQKGVLESTFEIVSE